MPPASALCWMSAAVCSLWPPHPRTLNLYVMFSRATQMQDMLLLRPPPRSFLEGGPPSSVRAALAQFEATAASSRLEAERLASLLGIPLPEV